MEVDLRVPDSLAALETGEVLYVVVEDFDFPLNKGQWMCW